MEAEPHNTQEKLAKRRNETDTQALADSQWGWLMLGQTIAERFCQTKDLAARRILQDEAAMVGAQGIIDERLAARLVRAEMKDLRRLQQTNQLEWLRGRVSVRVVEEDQDNIQGRMRPW